MAGTADPLAELLARVDQVARDSQGLLQQLAGSERRFRALAKAVWQVQEEERRRLSRELHDGLGQDLTALKNQLEILVLEAGAAPAGGGEGAGAQAGGGEAAGAQAGIAELGRFKARLAGAVELAARALHDTRELSRLLRPPILDDLGLVPALGWLSRRLRETAGFEVRLTCHGLEGPLTSAAPMAPIAPMATKATKATKATMATMAQKSRLADPAAGGGIHPQGSPRPETAPPPPQEPRLSPDLEILVFRVAQEALTNALKHSGAKGATLVLARRDGWLELEVADAGRGFDTQRALDPELGAAGSGVRGMRDRLDLYGGRLRILSAPGEGTRVVAAVPLGPGKSR